MWTTISLMLSVAAITFFVTATVVNETDIPLRVVNIIVLGVAVVGQIFCVMMSYISAQKELIKSLRESQPRGRRFGEPPKPAGTDPGIGIVDG